jgi:CBS domain-containing protein
LSSSDETFHLPPPGEPPAPEPGPAARRADPASTRARLTFAAAGDCERAVTSYCPVRDRAVSLEECRACRHCRPDGPEPDAVGCADPSARRQSGEALLRPPRPRSLADRTPLWQVMRPCVVCVHPELELEALLRMLDRYDLRAAPVIDGGGRPIGVVSRGDLAAACYAARDARGAGDAAAPPARTVGDVMMCMAFTLRENSSLSHAAALMAYEGVHRIPVVSLDGAVVGIVSSMDVVRWLAQHDGYVVPDSRSMDA